MWYQTYVSPGGQPIRIAGGIENGRMVMYSRFPDGTLATRWTWDRLDANTVRQQADKTSDNGTTWVNMFSGIYTKRP
jgi:hypothetical protein